MDLKYIVEAPVRAMNIEQKMEEREQKYNPFPIFPICFNCEHMDDSVTISIKLHGAFQITTHMCKLGKIEVHKGGNCNHHKFGDWVKKS